MAVVVRLPGRKRPFLASVEVVLFDFFGPKGS